MGSVRDCFSGYGTTFHNIWFSNTRRMGVFNFIANGIDFDYVFGDYTDGNNCQLVNSGGTCGSSAAGSAFEFNVTVGTANNYGNTFRNIHIEQGLQMSGGDGYVYAIDFNSRLGVNYVFGVDCSDPTNLMLHCVHIGSMNVLPQLVLGCSTAATPDFPGCVLMDGIGSYPDIVADLYNSNPAFYSRNYYGGNLGTSDHPFNYLHLAARGGIDSATNTTGIPNATNLFGGMVGFSNTTASTFGGTMGTNIYYPLFSDTSVTGSPAVPFTVFPFEAWLGQFTLNTSNNNGSAPMQMQPIYSSGGLAQLFPTVFSIAPGQSPGTPVTNAPPFYVPAGNPINFQAINTPAPNGSTFATVNGFAASLIGTTDTVLGTYYNGTVAAPKLTTPAFPSKQVGPTLVLRILRTP